MESPTSTSSKSRRTKTAPEAGQAPAGAAAAPASSIGADGTVSDPPPIPSKIIILGIDPDTHGAIAVLSWEGEGLLAAQQGAASAAVSAGAGPPGDAAQQQQQQQITGQQEICSEPWRVAGQPSSVRVFDVPTLTTQLLRKKKGGGTLLRNRTQVDVDALAALAWQLLAEHGGAPAGAEPPYRCGSSGGNGGGGGGGADEIGRVGGNGATSTSSSSSGGGGGSSNGVAGACGRGPEGGVLLRAFLEVAPIRPGNGTYSIHSLGFTLGAFQGAFTAAGFDFCTVQIRRWKRDLGLSEDKGQSRELALRVFPGCQGLISRAMDHGRAEALLIAAWASGLSIQLPQQQQQDKKRRGSAAAAAGAAEAAARNDGAAAAAEEAGTGGSGGDAAASGVTQLVWGAPRRARMGGGGYDFPQSKYAVSGYVLAKSGGGSWRGAPAFPALEEAQPKAPRAAKAKAAGGRAAEKGKRRGKVAVGDQEKGEGEAVAGGAVAGGIPETETSCGGGGEGTEEGGAGEEAATAAAGRRRRARPKAAGGTSAASGGSPSSRSKGAG